MSYDFIFVGTSPMCVLEACARRLAGHTVLMIDRAVTPGGAWKTHNMFGHDNIENGPHFLLYPDGDKYLRQDLGMDLKIVPNPEWLICDEDRPRRISDGAALLRLGARSLLKSAGQVPAALRNRRTRELGTGFRIGRKACHQLKTGLSFSLLRPQSWYLRNGSGPLVRALDCHARRLGVEFLMGASITQATVAKGAAGVRVDFVRAGDGGQGETGQEKPGQESVEARQLVLTDHSCIDRFDLGGKMHETLFDRRVRTQVHFFVSIDRPLDFYLLRFFSEKYFLLSNLSFVYDRAIAPPGQELLTLALLDATRPHELSRAEMERIAGDFMRWRVLPERTGIGEFTTTYYDDTRIRSKSQKLIAANAGDRIAFFGRADLSELIVERADFWRRNGLRDRCLAALAAEPQAAA